MEQGEGPKKRESTFPLFSKYFGAHPQDVVDHFGAMRKQLEDFIEAFKKRIEVEVTYSKNLTQVSKTLDRHIKPGTELTSSYICSAFKVEHEMRSRQAFELAESMRTEIEAVCSQLLRKETAFHKRMEKDVRRFYKQGGAVEEEHREAMSKFQAISRETEEMIITKNILKYTTSVAQDKKVKLISKTVQSIKENKEYEKLYVQAVRNYNKFASSYNEEVTSLLDQAESQVREQVTLQADCIRKLIVAEASLFKNIEYDIVNISTQMEHLDPQKDAETFVQELRDSPNNRIFPQLDPRRRGIEDFQYAVQPKPVAGKSMLSNSLLFVDEQYFSWMLFNKRNKKLRDAIAGAWKDLNHPLQQTDKPTIDKTETKQPQNDSLQKQEQEQEPKTETVQAQNKQEEVGEGDKGESLDPRQQARADWSKELREVISTLKIQQPPILSSEQPRKTMVLTVEGVFASFTEIMRTISQLWNLEEGETGEVNGKLARLQGYMGEHHLHRLVALLFLEQYRVQLQVMIGSPGCARMCSRVLKSIIRESQRQKDTFILRGLLALIFTFYWVDDKHKRLIYLSPEVHQCDIWRKNDFWEAAIFETTYEEMALFAKQKGETLAETNLRQKNLIFSQLASFCHYMVMLGITSKKVRLIVGRYCRLYEMTEDQNKDLSKMITNTSKQYKETAFQFSLKTQERDNNSLNND